MPTLKLGITENIPTKSMTKTNIERQMIDFLFDIRCPPNSIPHPLYSFLLI